MKKSFDSFFTRQKRMIILFPIDEQEIKKTSDEFQYYINSVMNCPELLAYFKEKRAEMEKLIELKKDKKQSP